jgi:CheY-like chemotaxis protein
MHILLAEDDLAGQVIVRHILERLGHCVVVVGNGSEAVEAAERWRFDVILMDIQMPGLDGFAATVQIRENERTKPFRTPIVALNSIDLGHIFFEAGMDGYLPKPANSDSVTAALRAVRTSAVSP